MRRELHLACLDDAIGECERLLESGYSKSGNWSLAQICCHLRLSIECNMTGYPKYMTILGYPLRPILHYLILPRLLSGDSPSGIKTAGVFIPPDDVVDEHEVERFKRCVAEFHCQTELLTRGSAK